MHEIYKNIIELLNNKEYGKILKIIIGIFVFTAPSISYLFIYEMELFLSLDVIKFSVLCLTLNLILLIGTFIIVLICKIHKFETSVTCINDKQGKELKYIQDKVIDISTITEEIPPQKKQEDFTKNLIEASEIAIQNDIKKLKAGFFEEIFIDTVTFITSYTMLMWTYHFFSNYFNTLIVSDYCITTVLIYIFVYVFQSLINLFKANKANGIISSIKNSFFLVIMEIFIILIFVIDIIK